MSTRSLSQIPKSVKPMKRQIDDTGSGLKDGINGNHPDGRPLAQEEFMNQFADRYPATKIKIVQDVTLIQKHLTHPINRMLADYNEFCRIVFRTRCTEQKAL